MAQKMRLVVPPEISDPKILLFQLSALILTDHQQATSLAPGAGCLVFKTEYIQRLKDVLVDQVSRN
jgi:hypothetical protein